MFPLSTYYGAALGKWTNNHPHVVSTKFQISSILGADYLKARNPVTAINSFRKCGIVQFDGNIFNEVDFLAETADDSQTSVLHSIDQPATTSATIGITQMGLCLCQHHSS
jgi:hypothetical protein